MDSSNELSMSAGICIVAGPVGRGVSCFVILKSRSVHSPSLAATWSMLLFADNAGPVEVAAVEIAPEAMFDAIGVNLFAEQRCWRGQPCC